MKRLANLLLTLLLFCGTSGCTAFNEEPPIPDVVNNLTSFYFQKLFNSESLLGAVSRPTIGEGAVEICSPLIVDRTALVATFKTDGGKVYVGDVEQVSNVTPNDFTNPVTYKVVSETGYTTEWVVSVTNTGLPIVVINTPSSKSIPSKYEDWLENTRLTIYNADLSVDFQGNINIRGRGNSTWGYPKKPYALKLNDKSSILGMPKHKRWVLLANWLDRTMMRNSAAFYLAEQTDLAWTPRGEFVEVVLNGSHKGNYFLCEQIKVDKNRVAIEELSDDNPTGSFIMEMDVYYDEVFKFHSPHYNMPYMFKDPDEVTDVQYNYFYDYVSTLEASLVDDERFAAREYTQYIDVDSYIDWWFVHELTGNSEPNHPKSSYFHKDRDGLLTAGPVWDFDWETFVPYKASALCNGNIIYFGRLFQDEAFVARVKERWALLKPRFETLPAYITSEAERLKTSAAINLEMWPIDVVVNRDENLTYDAAVLRMKSAYESKLRWLNNYISKL